MEIFITGGTGTIGSDVIRELRKRNHDVIALARSPEAAGKLRDLGAMVYPGDLSEPATWVERALACKTIIHAGASFTEQMAEIDQKVIRTIIRQSNLRAKKARLIYTGGIWLFPNSTTKPVNETTAFEPLPSFVWMSEQVRSLQAARNLNLGVIHPALVCGKYKGPVASLIRAAKTEAPFKSRATLDTLWPLVSSQDLATLYADAAEQGPYRISLLACGLQGVSVGQICQAIEKRLGRPVPFETLAPDPDADPKTDIEAGYAKSQLATSVRASKSMKWQPRHSTLEDLIDWHLL